MSRQGSKIFVGVTGAHSVGKSTFCTVIVERLERLGAVKPLLLAGLGDKVRQMGIPVGAAADSDTVTAIFNEHLRRENDASADLVILDRCIVDALAYTRHLGVTTPLQTRLLEEVTRVAASRLSTVIHLELSETFIPKIASHETPAMRADIALKIPEILIELGVRHISVDASHPDAADLAEREVASLMSGH